MGILEMTMLFLLSFLTCCCGYNFDSKLVNYTVGLDGIK